MFETCFLHIGAPKTGSTSIQRSVWGARALLEAHSVHYPGVAPNHKFLVSSFMADPERFDYNRMQGRSAAEIAANDARSRAEFERAARASASPTLALSSEHMVMLDAPAISRLRAYLGTLARNVRLVVYLRHPLSAVGSFMQEAVKTGSKRLATMQQNPPFTDAKRILPPWAEAFGKPNVILREMHADALVNGDVVDDFLTVVGFGGPFGQVARVRANESLSAPAVLIADALAGVAPKFSGDRGEERRIQSFLFGIKGPKFVPEAEVLRRTEQRAKGHVAYLEQEWGIRLRPPALATATMGTPFDDAALSSLAALINEASKPPSGKGRPGA
jgi:hypothetical protein